VIFPAYQDQIQKLPIMNKHHLNRDVLTSSLSLSCMINNSTWFTGQYCLVPRLVNVFRWYISHVDGNYSVKACLNLLHAYTCEKYNSWSIEIRVLVLNFPLALIAANFSASRFPTILCSFFILVQISDGCVIHIDFGSTVYQASCTMDVSIVGGQGSMKKMDR